MISENRIYQAYYTKSDPIVNYMVSLLSLKGSEKILEPCAGDGVFIDPIAKTFPDVQIDAYELNDYSYANLLVKYSDFENINVKKTDTLTDIDLQFLCSMGGGYDAIIANPPYGAWRDQEERRKLKRSYNGFYAKESYSLFLYRCIEALNDKGKLVFIIPDTYLNLHMHKDIRKYILTHTKIKEISLFPSSYFPGVNFGYANLSIIALEKCLNQKSNLENEFSIIKGFSKVEELGSNSDNIRTFNLKQKDVLNSPDFSFATNGDKPIANCLNFTESKIGDICDCVTGFYSGNDKDYLKVRDKTIRNSKRYEAVNLDFVEFNCDASLVDGLTNEKEYVPIVKGGNRKYYKPDDWFMKWSSEKVDFFKSDKKARYQNSSYYFRKGIGVPMVSSSSITGVLIENRLFDQSIVGIFPKDETYLYYLLAFFNSPTCNKLIRTINSSTNNSANYIKKIPFLEPENQVLEKVSERIKTILEACKTSHDYDCKLEELNNNAIKEIYGF
ncbi:MAG: N-6 DNA methylase [Saprospiraceae bacterium]